MTDPALIGPPLSDLALTLGRTGISRRNFLAHASCFGAFYGVAARIPMATLSERLVVDSRVSQTAIADKGFAAVRKVGDGLYATITDPSKGFVTLCNGGMNVGTFPSSLPLRM